MCPDLLYLVKMEDALLRWRMENRPIVSPESEAVAVTIPDEPTWEMLIGLMQGSGSSVDRSSTGVWALEQLRAILGDSWPELWYAKQGRLPGLLIDATFHATAYTRLLRFALQLTSLKGTPGLGQLTKELRGQHESHRLTHAQLQLEVASLLAALGLEVTLETMRHDAGRPADVLLPGVAGGRVVECFAVHLDAVSRADASYDARMSRSINEILFRHGVFLAGDLGPRLADDETKEFVEALTAAAERVAGNGAEQVVRWGKAEVRVLPMEQATGQTLTGPTSTMQGWVRGSTIIHSKAAEWNQSELPVWLRFDLHDGMWMFSDWAVAPLARKTSWLSALVRHSLAGLTVEGVVVSSGAAMCYGAVVGESCRFDDGSFGLRRQLARFLARETIIVPLTANAESMTEMWVEAYDREADWLDDAFDRAGLPSSSALELR